MRRTSSLWIALVAFLCLPLLLLADSRGGPPLGGGDAAGGLSETFGPFELELPFPEAVNVYTVPGFDDDGGTLSLQKVEVLVDVGLVSEARFKSFTIPSNAAQFGVGTYYAVAIDLDGDTLYDGQATLSGLAAWEGRSYALAPVLEEKDEWSPWVPTAVDDVGVRSMAGNLSMWLGETVALPVAEVAANTATLSGAGGVGVGELERAGRFWVTYYWEERDDGASPAMVGGRAGNGDTAALGLRETIERLSGHRNGNEPFTWVEEGP